MGNQLSDIEHAIHAYLDGFYTGDVDKLAQVFYPGCALTQSVDGVLQVISRDRWLEIMRQRPSPASLGLPRCDEILVIDVVDDFTAHVKLKCAIPPRYFTDLLALLKVEGRWQVVQKIYATRDRP